MAASRLTQKYRITNQTGEDTSDDQEDDGRIVSEMEQATKVYMK